MRIGFIPGSAIDETRRDNMHILLHIPRATLQPIQEIFQFSLLLP